MKRSTEISIMRRVFQGIKNRQVSEMLAESNKLPVELYTSPENFFKEKNTLFKDFPLMVGFSSQISNYGDYITHNLTDTPIIVIRDKELNLKAYINVCRHRGAPILKEACGNKKGNLSCPFHGWCYSSKDGSLKGLPQSSGFPGLDKNEYGLISLNVEEKFGMVFVLPNPKKNFNLDAYLGEIYQNLDSFGYTDRVLYKANVQTKKMNWKSHIEINSEGYHFPFLHKETSADNFLTYGGVTDYIKPHYRMIAPQKNILKMMNQEEKEWKLEGNAAIVYFIFPNTFYFTGADFGHVLSVYPQNESNCTFLSGTLVPNIEFSSENKSLWELQYQYYWAAMDEDMDIGESIHTVLQSDANSHHIFGGYEQMCFKFGEMVQEVVKGNYNLEDIMNTNSQFVTIEI